MRKNESALARERRRSREADYRTKHREKRLLLLESWRERNRQKTRDDAKAYYWKNRDAIKAKRDSMPETRKQALRVVKAEKFKEWKSSQHGKEMSKKWRQSNLADQMARTLRSRLRCVLAGESKNGSAVRDLGCDMDYLIFHLESKFSPGMSWENHGRYGWHIDHIRPLASFDLSDRAQFLEACHFTNLQPLWAADNLSKSDTYAATS